MQAALTSHFNSAADREGNAAISGHAGDVRNQVRGWSKVRSDQVEPPVGSAPGEQLRGIAPDFLARIPSAAEERVFHDGRDAIAHRARVDDLDALLRPSRFLPGSES